MPRTLTCPACETPFTGLYLPGVKDPCSGCGRPLVVRLELALG